MAAAKQMVVGKLEGFTEGCWSNDVLQQELNLKVSW